jgi:hypothetical protein
MIRCRNINSINLFRTSRPVFDGEKAETATSAPESREALAEKYADNGKRNELYTEAEKAASDVIKNPEASAKAKAAAERVMQLTATARANEQKYGLDPAYFMNEEAVSLHMRYSNLLKIARSGGQETAAAKPAQTPAERKAPATVAVTPASRDAANKKAKSTTDELAELDKQTMRDMARVQQQPNIRDTSKNTPKMDMPAQPASTGPALNLAGAGSTQPIRPGETVRTAPAATPRSAAAAKPASSSDINAGRAPQVEGPRVAERESSQPARREVGVGRLPDNVRKAYELFTRNPNSPNTVDTPDAKYSFERYTSQMGSGDNAVSIARVRVYKEPKV